MSCEFTSGQRGPAVAHYQNMADGAAAMKKAGQLEAELDAELGDWLARDRAEIEAMKKAELKLEAELDAEGRYLLACVLALVGGVGAVAFTLGYVSAQMGLL